MENLFAGNEHEDSKSRKGVDRVENTKEDKEEHDKEERTEEARQGNSDTEEGRTGRTAREEQKELPRLVSIEEEEQPEQLILEVKESKRKKKTKKKTANKVKDEIKLALVGMYALAGATLDKCFFLKPSEADLLAEAIYRYLDEHNLLDIISKKSALVNLIIALISVNTPKFYEYYKNLKAKKGGKEDDKEREAKLDNRQSADGRHSDVINAKTHLDKFYITDEGRGS